MTLAQTLTTFCRRLAPAQRNTLHFITGTFEADPKRIRSDAERALRRLDLEQVRFFMLFWVRSWQRITPDVVRCLETLQQEGKISAFGLSTHSRPLAVEAIERGWNPVMVRHSAAHRGAEEAVFPAAIKHNVGLISFNNTNYGRLLQNDRPQEKGIQELLPFSAADCYRFFGSFEENRV